jgi:hypothetical protein
MQRGISGDCGCCRVCDAKEKNAEMSLVEGMKIGLERRDGKRRRVSE